MSKNDNWIKLVEPFDPYDVEDITDEHYSKLVNMTVSLYAQLGCTQDESYDYILEKLLEIEAFDFDDTIEAAKWKAKNQSNLHRDIYGK